MSSESVQLKVTRIRIHWCQVMHLQVNTSYQCFLDYFHKIEQNQMLKANYDFIFSLSIMIAQNNQSFV